MSQNVRGPMTVNREYYIISKVAYEYFLGSVEPNSCNNANSKELNDLQSRIQTLERTCQDLRDKNGKLLEEAKKYQSETDDATNFHSHNNTKSKELNDLQSRNQMFEEKYKNLLKLHNDIQSRNQMLGENYQNLLKVYNDLQSRNQMLEENYQNLLKVHNDRPQPITNSNS